MTRLLPPATLNVRRNRLTERLPDSPGFVVWLEAPYGHGKSVLASQWAATLERAGWRILWLSLMGENVRIPLARTLNLPPDVPWTVLRPALWAPRTLLVLEELEGTEELSAVLRDPQGLVLLASRAPLPEPELPRLRSDGHLIHLTARDLCFTLDEAQQLFPDLDLAEAQWRRTGGWPLPLNLAALTGTAGDTRDHAALLRGLRDSLTAREWEETLLLSAVDYLPSAAADDHTRRLADAGFVQALEVGFRLHPLIADMITAAFTPDRRRAVELHGPRLPLPLRGDAYARAGAGPELASLLDTEQDLGNLYPAQVLRWDDLSGAERGALHECNVGDALAATGRVREGLPLLLAAARRPGQAPDVALAAYRRAIWYLAEAPDPDEAARVEREAGALLGRVDAVDASRYLNNASRLAFETGDYAAGEAMVTRALNLLEPGHPRRASLQMNLGLLRFYVHGDLEGRIAHFEAVLDDPILAAAVAASRSAAHYDLGRHWLLLGQPDRARTHFTQATQHGQNSPWNHLVAQGFLHLLDGDFSAVTGTLARLEPWQKPAHEHQLRTWATLALLERGRASEARTLLNQRATRAPEPQPSTPMHLAAQALTLHALGEREQAAALLARPVGTDREALLYWHAASYRITRAPGALDALLAQTTAGARVLPALIPLADLPRARPELARSYPLAQVLSSGWTDAVRLRHGEIPPLVIRTLGTLDVQRLGEPLVLTQRPRELLLLLLLGRHREELADELWPGLAPDAARNNLNVTLSALRRAVEPWGVPTYLTRRGLTRVQADLHDLQGALSRGDAPAALALYRGDLAPEVDLPSVQVAREALRREVVDTLHTAAIREPERAEAYLERVLELDPLNESALADLVRTLEGQGRAQQARARRDAFQVRLARELGEG